MHKPRDIHWNATLRILTYLKGSLGKRLLYKNYEHLRIEDFSDPNYARDKDIESLFMVIALILEIIWLLRGVRSRVLYLVPVLKQSI